METVVYHLHFDSPIISCFINEQREICSELNFTGEFEKVLFVGNFDSDVEYFGKKIVVMHIQGSNYTREDKMSLIAEFLNSLHFVYPGETKEIKINCTSLMFEDEALPEILKSKIFR